MAKNSIYRGPIEREPRTLNLAVVGAYLPGTAVFVNADNKLEQADAPDQRLLVLSNLRLAGQSVDQAYVVDDTGVAYRARNDDEYLGRFAAGTYARGDALTIENGQFTAASGSALVVAYYDGKGGTLEAGTLDDLIVATNPHSGAAEGGAE